MNPDNSENQDDDVIPFDGVAPMQGFPGGWNPSTHPYPSTLSYPFTQPYTSNQPYPYVHGGWSAALNQGFRPFPVRPSSPAAVESVQPAVMKESQGEPAVLKESGEPASGRRRKGTTNRSKLSNFSPKEDVFLVKSWLEVSCEPITNTGQKREGFWARIVNQYNVKRDTYPERTLRSLQSRWEGIKAEGSKFASYMANVLRDNPSGMSDADKTSLALANFAEIEQYPFVYMHCWDLLKDEPKWMDLSHRGARHGDNDRISNHIPPTSDTINLDPEIPSPQPESSRGKRPIGRDATQSAAKKSASSSNSESSQYVSKLQDLSMQNLRIWQEENVRRGGRYEETAAIEAQRYEEVRKHNEHMAAIEEEKLKLMRTKVDIQQTREEERILAIDLDNCPERLRKYYQAKQAAILRKLEEDNSK